MRYSLDRVGDPHVNHRMLVHSWGRVCGVDI